jgi:hypothetical protein
MENCVAGPIKEAKKASKPKAKKTAKKVPATGAEEKATTSECSAKAPIHIHPTQSPLEEISDLLDNLPIDACMELTRRLLTAIPSLPSGAARTRAVLKTVVLFIAEYGSTA